MHFRPIMTDRVVEFEFELSIDNDTNIEKFSQIMILDSLLFCKRLVF